MSSFEVRPLALVFHPVSPVKSSVSIDLQRHRNPVPEAGTPDEQHHDEDLHRGLNCWMPITATAVMPSIVIQRDPESATPPSSEIVHRPSGAHHRQADEEIATKRPTRPLPSGGQGRDMKRLAERGGADLGRQGVSHLPCSWAPQTQRKRKTTCEPE